VQIPNPGSASRHTTTGGDRRIREGVVRERSRAATARPLLDPDGKPRLMPVVLGNSTQYVSGLCPPGAATICQLLAHSGTEAGRNTFQACTRLNFDRLSLRSSQAVVVSPCRMHFRIENFESRVLRAIL
jgi:hypothetical protein